MANIFYIDVLRWKPIKTCLKNKNRQMCSFSVPQADMKFSLGRIFSNCQDTMILIPIDCSELVLEINVFSTQLKKLKKIVFD